jgi:hypothetical protein
LPIEPETGCEVEPKVDPEGERELDEVDPPADELPPAVEEPPEWPPAWQDEEGEKEELRLDEERPPRPGAGVAGTASESRNTSPRMCSANWWGTPDWLTGWVKITCNPVAVTVSALEFDEPPARPK